MESILAFLAILFSACGTGITDKDPYMNTPFEGLGFTVPTSGDLTLDTALDTTGKGRTNPFSAKTVRVTTAVSPIFEDPKAVFIRAHTVVFDGGSISVPGDNGAGDTGGHGCGGGGGGGTAVSEAGGAGGDGSQPGTSTTAGEAGQGLANSFVGNFEYGHGGQGGRGGDAEDDGDFGAGGAGSHGCGGGGGGGEENGGAGGGGGGGGGLIVIVAEAIEGAGSLFANGGSGVDTPTCDGGSGGGGVVWIAARSFDGQIPSPNVLPGTINPLGCSGIVGQNGIARIFKILDDGSLEEKEFGEAF